ncbi:hypothetical protein [Microbacterium maritypicum]
MRSGVASAGVAGVEAAFEGVLRHAGRAGAGVSRVSVSVESVSVDAASSVAVLAGCVAVGVGRAVLVAGELVLAVSVPEAVVTGVAAVSAVARLAVRTEIRVERMGVPAAEAASAEAVPGAEAVTPTEAAPVLPTAGRGVSSSQPNARAICSSDAIVVARSSGETASPTFARMPSTMPPRRSFATRPSSVSVQPSPSATIQPRSTSP